MSLRTRTSGRALLVAAALAPVWMAGCKTEIGTAPRDLGTADQSVNDMTIPDQSVPRDLSGPQQDVILPPDAVVSVTYAALLTMFESAYCSHLVKCGQLDSSRLAQCMEVARGLKIFTFDPNFEVQQHRLVLNDATCAQAYGNARCDGTDTGQIEGGSCANLFIAKQTMGQACISDLECVNGYCATNGDDGGSDYANQGCASPGGHCEPYLAIGLPCTAGNQCNPNNAICGTGNLCQALIPDNSPCPYAAYSAANIGHQPCQLGAFCKITTAGAATGICTRPTGSGNVHDNCDEWQDNATLFPSCATGLYCSHLAADQQNGLPACAKKIASGQVCDPTATVSVNNPAAVPCVDGTECFHKVGDTTGVSQCHPEIALGGACVVTDSTQVTPSATSFNSHCQTTLWCQPGGTGVGTCQLQGATEASTATPNCDPSTAGGYGNCLSVGDPALFSGVSESCISVGSADGGVCRPVEGAGDSCDPTVDNATPVSGLVGPACEVGSCSPATTNAPPTCHPICP